MGGKQSGKEKTDKQEDTEVMSKRRQGETKEVWSDTMSKSRLQKLGEIIKLRKRSLPNNDIYKPDMFHFGVGVQQQCRALSFTVNVTGHMFKH